MNKRLLKLAAVFAAAVILSGVCGAQLRADTKFGDDRPVTRAMAAKMLAFTRYGRYEIDTLGRQITFSDTVKELWYDRYINACFVSGLMSGAGGIFMPDKPLTLEQAGILLRKIDQSGKIQLEITAANRNLPISQALWAELYLSALAVAGDCGITFETRVVMAYGGKLSPGYAITDAGPVSCAGLDLSEFLDKSVTMLMKDNEVLSVLDVVSDVPVIKNAYLVSVENGAITIFSGGAERSYIGAAPGLESGVVCDVMVFGNKALDVKPSGTAANGVIKRLGNGEVELSDESVYKLDANLKIYGLDNGAVKWRYMDGVAVGSDTAALIIKDGVCVAIITRGKVPEDIRVLISATGFKGYIHETVSVAGDKGFTVTSATGVKNFAPNEIYSVPKPDPLLVNDFGRVYITPNQGGKLRILSVKRAWDKGESPQYRGKLEIAREQGGYSIVNELPIEEYLYAVVPSETPSSYGLMASEVQALTARSFAYSQFYQNRFSQYGAQVDDSVSCQVYNNIPENELSIAAVDATRGQCIVYNGSVITANFFSTSAGVTANAGEVWSGGGEFPAATEPYLKSRSLLLDGSFPDFSNEQTAYGFFKNTEVQSYDSGFAWFRWNVSMTAAELSNSINAALSARYAANPALIKTRQSDGSYKSAPIQTIGTLTDISVERRGQGGNILALKLSGTAATLMVYTEYNIRSLLKPPASTPVYRKDGTMVKDFGMLPSAFFAMDKSMKDGRLASVVIYGGGYGHGVGASQNAAKAMADSGMSLEEIIKAFYSGAELVRMLP